MTGAWMHMVPVSPLAAKVRRRLSVAEFRWMQDSAERLSLVSPRPLSEITDRLLVSLDDMEEGNDVSAFLELLGDVCEDHDASR